jgi:hypothetical protein
MSSLATVWGDTPNSRARAEARKLNRRGLLICNVRASSRARFLLATCSPLKRMAHYSASNSPGDATFGPERPIALPLKRTGPGAYGRRGRLASPLPYPPFAAGVPVNDQESRTAGMLSGVSLFGAGQGTCAANHLPSARTGWSAAVTATFRRMRLVESTRTRATISAVGDP